AVIGTQERIKLDSNRAPLSFECPHGAGRLKIQDSMPFKIGRTNRCSETVKIRRRRNDGAIQRIKRGFYNTVKRLRQHSNGDIKSLLYGINRTVHDNDVECQLRVSILESSQPMVQELRGQRGRDFYT